MDISWQPGGVKYIDIIFFFLTNSPWINISLSLPNLQDTPSFGCPYGTKHSQHSVLQQLSLHRCRVSPIPCMWERMRRAEVCNTWMVWPNSWSHACGIANMSVKNCLKSFQVKHSSTFRSLWNTAGWKLLTVWSIRLWNSFPREVLEELSFESFSAEGNIL